jgi:PAS domain-containing protein
MAAIEQAIPTRSVFQLEDRVLKADGAIGWTFSRAVAITRQDGIIIEWFGAAGDITEKKSVFFAAGRNG